MNRTTLLALVFALPACTQPVDEGDVSVADPAQPAQEPSYVGEGPEPPEGYCQPFTTHKDVYSPQALEIDLEYCYNYADWLARQYVIAHGGISCGQMTRLYAPWTNETWHCGMKWYVWVPY